MVDTPKQEMHMDVSEVDEQSPRPHDNLQINPFPLSKDTVLHRIHPSQYPAVVFNSSPAGNARFSPISDALNQAVPTLYAGSSFECAVMETAFHDVPYTAGSKTTQKGKLQNLIYSQLTLTKDVTLADLSARGLRKLGIKKTELIETEADRYPVTRQWAEAIHAQHPNIQGLKWTSRQDDNAHAFMFFGDRIGQDYFQQVGTSKSLTQDPATYSATLDLADEIGVDIVDD